MSFQKYERYKDSGVEWLGEVPEGWEIVQLKQFLDLQNGADHKGVERDDGYPVIGSGGPFAYASDYLYSGESVLLGRKGTIDKPIYINGPFWTVDTMYWSKIKSSTSGKLAYYVAQTIPFDFYSTNTALPSMTKCALNSHLVCRPSLPEQNLIANFLDRETAKVDALVAEQEKLIGLLKEKRRAVISHAVTKGLDPNSPMKDSGVEWLGQVPKEWEVKRLKFAVSMIVDCPHETPRYSEEGGYMVIRTADIESGRISSRNMYRVDDDEYQNRVRRATLLEGDIVYSREGERWGHAAMVPKGQTFCLGQRMMQFRFAESSPAYSMWQLNSENIYRQGQLDIVGATSPHVNVSTIRNYVLANPPLVEQAQIAFHLDTETAKLDELTAEAERSIELLKERRFALISAAVTGKIDVRNAA